MRVGWAERWRLSRVLYREIAFQSIYALKSGNLFSGQDEKRKAGGPKRAERVVLQSKLTISGFFVLTFLASSVAIVEGRTYLPTSLSPVFFDGTIIAMVLVVLFSLIWITGLQVALPYESSQAVTALLTLPISEDDAAWVTFLSFLRLFDAPLLTGLLAFPITVGLALGSWLAALAAVPAVLVTEVFALSLSLLMARFFSRSVTGASGGSLISLLGRWLYLTLWTIPSLIITIFVTFSTSIIATLGIWQVSHPLLLNTLFALFPFPFAYIISAAGLNATTPSTLLSIVVASFAFYVGVGGMSAYWLHRAPLNLSRTTARPRILRTGRIDLVVSIPVLAILKKDLRIASRTPAYAFLLLLPLLDSFVLGLFTDLGNPDPSRAESYALAAVTVAVLLATLFGPVFFATEVLGFSLTRTMPLTQRTMIIGKTTLVSGVYVLSFTIVTLLVVSRMNHILGFVLFAMAELPAVAAAALLEIGILLDRAEKTGTPVANLYSGAWWTTAVVIPGLIVAMVPLATYEFAGPTMISPLTLMAVTALMILVTIAALVLHGKVRPL